MGAISGWGRRSGRGWRPPGGGARAAAKQLAEAVGEAVGEAGQQVLAGGVREPAQAEGGDATRILELAANRLAETTIALPRA